MSLNFTKQRGFVHFFLAIFLLSLGPVGCGQQDLSSVKLNGKLPKVYVQTVARGASIAPRGRRLIDRLPRKSVKQIARNSMRTS